MIWLKKINYWILSIFIFLFLFLSPVYASSYTVSDIKMNDVIKHGEDFNVSVFVSNNTDSTENIDYNVTIYNPRGEEIYYKDLTIEVEGYQTKEEVVTIGWTDLGEDAPSSNNSYLLQAHALEGVNIVGQIKRNYFIISAGPRKIPISDMPIVLSFVFLIVIVVLFSSKNKKK